MNNQITILAILVVRVIKPMIVWERYVPKDNTSLSHTAEGGFFSKVK